MDRPGYICTIKDHYMLKKILLLLIVMTSTFCVAQEKVETKEYLYKVHLPKRLHNDKKWTDKDKEIVGLHFAYLQKALKEGKLILAGRTNETKDKTFGIVIYRADNDDEAKLFMQNDPAVKAGVMIASFHKYNVALKEN